MPPPVRARRLAPSPLTHSPAHPPSHAPACPQAPWLYMIETDFVFVKPIQAPLAESSARSVAFPYGYIQPTYPTIEVRRPGTAGNAP